MTLTMYDAIYASNDPVGADAYAGYVNGRWPDYQATRQRFPNHPVLSITVNSTGDADCLDIEIGDAQISDAPGWVHRQQQAGAQRPCLYTSQSNLTALVNTLAAAGIARSDVRIWSAHYGAGKHICGPATCGAAVDCDGTQWDSTDLYDVSVLRDTFFQAVMPAHVTPEEDMARLVKAAGDTHIWATDGVTRTYVSNPTELRELIAIGLYGDGKVHTIDPAALAPIPILGNKPQGAV